MRRRQLLFFEPRSSEHGGEINRGRRKAFRPIDTKCAMHIVLRSSRARGEWSLLHPQHQKQVDRHARRIAEKHGVRLYRYANVGNHLHLLVKTPSRRAFQSFLREVSGVIAACVTGGRKGNPVGRFWDYLAYSRRVTWGREFRNLELYFIKNLFEAAGLLTWRMKEAGVGPIPLAGWLAPKHAAA
jgi:REP element-mobilizing transposase RayT